MDGFVEGTTMVMGMPSWQVLAIVFSVVCILSAGMTVALVGIMRAITEHQRSIDTNMGERQRSIDTTIAERQRSIDTAIAEHQRSMSTAIAEHQRSLGTTIAEYQRSINRTIERGTEEHRVWQQEMKAINDKFTEVAINAEVERRLRERQ